MSRNRMPDLARLAGVRREAALAALSHAARECERLRADIAALHQTVVSARLQSASGEDLRAAIKTERYAEWAEQAQARLNLSLARETVHWIEKRQAAALAHGQSEVLRRIAADLKGAELQARARRAVFGRPIET